VPRHAWALLPYRSTERGWYVLNGATNVATWNYAKSCHPRWFVDPTKIAASGVALFHVPIADEILGKIKRTDPDVPRWPEGPNRATG
jgi:hypothetical protein